MHSLEMLSQLVRCFEDLTAVAATLILHTYEPCRLGAERHFPRSCATIGAKARIANPGNAM